MHNGYITLLTGGSRMLSKRTHQNERWLPNGTSRGAKQGQCLHKLGLVLIQQRFAQ